MTRWARAGSAQKHKKLPGDATKWGEFDFQRCNNTSSEQKVQIKRNHDTNCKPTVSSPDFSTRKNLGSKKRKKSALLQDEKNMKSKSGNESNEKASVSVNVNAGLANEEINNGNNSSSENTSKKVKNKKKIIKQNLEQAEISQTSDVKESKKKKKTYLEKLKMKRAENGILLLPPKIERKLYMIKRKLREKRVPPEVIKDILRKERRREELKFRKTFNPSKLCFHCRQAGHVLADCPTKLGSSNQETGICFKCGSAEHTSYKCPEDVQGFPFAKCFICKEQGHISKDCPRNKHGVYPKGGRCNFCGNVNHLKKDCPSLSKRKDDESTVTLQTINEGTSIDAEVPMSEISLKKEKVKKPKIVKF